MCGATAWATKKEPRRFVSSTVFQSSQVTSAARLRTLQPALLTSTSMWPNASCAASAMLPDAALVSDVEVERDGAAAEALDLLLERPQATRRRGS